MGDGAVGMTAQEDPRLRLDNAAQLLGVDAGGGGVSGGGASGDWGNINGSSTTSSGGARGSSGGGMTLWIASQPGQPLPDESAIRGAFMGFGVIRSVRCLAHKGFAFIEFATAQAASAGLAAGIREVAGFPVVVKWARSKNSNGVTSGNNNNNNRNNNVWQHEHPHQRGSTGRSSAPSFE